jgi:hypothetical protein
MGSLFLAHGWCSMNNCLTGYVPGVTEQRLICHHSRRVWEGVVTEDGGHVRVRNDQERATMGPGWGTLH